MSVSRRGFLGLLAGAAVAGPELVKLPRQVIGVDLGAAESFLAVSVMENGTHRVITTASNPSALWPGIKEWCVREYAKVEARGFEGLVDMWEADGG